MNYAGHEALRRDIAGLANSLCDLKTTLKVLEERYHYRHDGLPERLAGVSLRRTSELLDKAFSQVLMLVRILAKMNDGSRMTGHARPEYAAGREFSGLTPGGGAAPQN